MAKTAKTAKSAFVVSPEEEAFLTALRALLGSASEVEEADEDDEDEEVEEDEDEDEEEEVEVPDRETVEAMGIKDLRELAESLGIESKKKADILAALEEYFEDEDEDDDEDDEDEDEVDYDSMTLKELREAAKDAGMKPAAAKKADKDELVEFLSGDEEDEDEDYEDEDDDDEEVIDEDALNAMSHKELLALAKELEVKVPAALKKSTKANSKKLVAKILDSGEEE